MMTRQPVKSYGPPAVNPEGVLWAKYPSDLWGDVSKAVQFCLHALLIAWNGLTIIEMTRKELRDKINELRAAKGWPPITDLDSVTYYFGELKKLGVIERGRVEEKKNDWYTKLTKLFQAKVDEKPAVQVGKPVPSGPPKIEAPSQVLDLSYGPWAEELHEKHGWRLIVNDKGELERAPIEGRDQDELPPDAHRGVWKIHTASILAFLKGTHQRE